MKIYHFLLAVAIASLIVGYITSPSEQELAECTKRYTVETCLRYAG